MGKLLRKIRGEIVCHACGTRSRDFLIFLGFAFTLFGAGYGLYLVWQG